MELLERLRDSALFSYLDEGDLARVAALARVHEVTAGMVLSRQADLGATFFLIDRGEAIARRVDDKGFARPVATLREGDSFGVTSLFVSEPRDATVIARTDMRLWTISRADLQALLRDNPGLARMLAVPTEVADRDRMPTFRWLTPAERVVHFSRRHWLPLLVRLVLATVIAAGLALLSVTVLLVGADWDPTPVLILLAGVYVAYVIWHWLDWANDYVVVTSQRISYREQVALFYETRNEVPIDRVQNINVIIDMISRAFRYGTMVIETASQDGTLLLEQMPHPDQMRDIIWDQAERAQATRQAMERRLMADALAVQLSIDTDESLPADHALEEGLLADPDGDGDTGGVDRNPWQRVRGWLRTLVLGSDDDSMAADHVMWRKHPFFLFRSMVVPLLMTAGTLSLALFVPVSLPDWLAFAETGFAPLMLLFAVCGGGWLAWVIADWANDQYMITDDRIVDIEQRPFSLRSERREASLGMIQNVRFVIPNFGAAVLGYGSVLVQTAGRGDFTFDHVSRPAEVQAEVFRRIEAYRERARKQETDRRRSEIAEWFSIYDELGNRRALPTATLTDPEPGDPLSSAAGQSREG